MKEYITSKEERIFLHSWLSSFGREKQTYILYGTGNICLDIIDYIDEFGLPHPEYIVDHMPALSNLKGFKVLDIAKCKLDDFDFILLATNTYQNKMEAQIKKRFGDKARFVGFSHIKRAAQNWDIMKMAANDEKSLGKLYNIFETYKGYCLYGKSNFFSRMIALLRFHKLPLPERIVIADNSLDNSDFEGIKTIKISRLLDGYSQCPVIIDGDSYSVLEKTKLLKEKNANQEVIDFNSSGTNGEFVLRLNEKTKLPFIMNRSVYLGVTRRCNLKCVYCNHTSSELLHDNGKEMPLEQAEKIIQKFKGYVSFALLSGEFGEPLMYEHLEKLIETAAKCAPIVEFVTNAVLLSKERSISLARAGLHHIHISIDSACPEYNKKVRGIDTEQILRNVENFSRFTGLNVGINAVITKNNIHLMPGLAGLKKRIPTLQGITVHPVCSSSQNSLDGICEMSFLDSAQFESYFNGLKELCQKEGMSCSTLGQPLALQRKRKTRICNRPWNSFYVNMHGNLVCCSSGIDREGEFIAQNVLTAGISIPEVYNSELFQKFRKANCHGEMPELCKQCSYAY